jgi:hypothetical protein
MTHAGRMSRPIVKSIVSRTRDQGSTDPRVAELPVEKIAAAFKAAVAVAPPLSPEQLARRAADLLMEREPRSNEPGNETPVPTVRVSMFARVCLRDVRGGACGRWLARTVLERVVRQWPMR